MKPIKTLLWSLLIVLTIANSGFAQTPPTAQQLSQAEKAFEAADELMKQRKYAEALARYKGALAIADFQLLVFN